MIAFPTSTLETLHEVCKIALKGGGTDEGAPGPRLDDSPTHYAYVRDPAGNKLAFYCDNVGVEGSSLSKVRRPVTRFGG